MKLLSNLSLVSVAYAAIPHLEFLDFQNEKILKNDQILMKNWREYKLKFNKNYNPVEDRVRFQNFVEKVEILKAHNENGDSKIKKVARSGAVEANPNQPTRSKMKLGLNKFSDWTNDEFLEYNRFPGQQGQNNNPEEPGSGDDDIYYNGYPLGGEFECPQKIEDWLKFNDYPQIESKFASELDWRDASKNPKNLVADVGAKDQGQCGSCFAFSAVAVMEGSLCYNGKYDCSSWEGLSEQHILDCGTDLKSDIKGTLPWFGFNGCAGGFQPNVFEYAYYTDGISSGESYPYESGVSTKKGECRATESIGFPDKSICGTVNRHGWRSSEENPLEDTPSLMKHALYFKGPITVAMFVNGSFSAYQDGVYTAEQAESDGCGSQGFHANHALTAVGYGVYDDFSAEGHVTIPYWIIKNSWSSAWGDNGYVKVEMGKNVCGVEDNVNYVNMKSEN